MKKLSVILVMFSIIGAGIFVVRNNVTLIKASSNHLEKTSYIPITESSKNESTITSSKYTPTVNAFETELKSILSLSDQYTLDIQLTQLLTFWLNKQPVDSLLSILSLNQPPAKIMALTKAMDIWHSIDSIAFEKWLFRTPYDSTIESALINNIHSHSINKIEALHWASYLKDSVVRENQISHMLNEWVIDSPSDAIDWIVSNPDNNSYAGRVYQELIDYDLVQAVSVLDSLSQIDSSNQIEISQILSTKILGQDNLDENIAPILFNTLNALPDSELKYKALTALASELFIHLPPNDGLALIDQLPQDNVKTTLQRSLARQWAKDDPWAAFQFAQSLTEEGIRKETTQHVVEQWAKLDLQSANKWLKSVEKPADSYIQPVIRSAIRENNSNIAKDWINKLSKDEIKIEYIAQVSQLLYAQDKESAQRFVGEQGSLTTVEKEKLLNFLQAPSYPVSQY